MPHPSHTQRSSRGLPHVGDAALLSVALTGDVRCRERAFAEIARRFGPGLTAYAERLAPGCGEDLCQEALLELAKRDGPLRDNAALGGWLYGVARNKALDLHRRGRVTVPLEDRAEALADPSAEVEHCVAVRASGAALLAALGEQPVARRTTLTLRFVNGLSNAEIERVRGVRGVKQEVSRSLPGLRSAYERRLAAS